tara:strand:- start:115 stop:735 length:621 start_codon:yes stop_codon:yes gene_type:complete
MCGRYVVTYPVTKTQKLVKKAINTDNIENYNAHPYQSLPIIKKYINGNTLEKLKWGINPSWAQKNNYKPIINARLETINEKVTFKKLIKFFRCVVIADGYYEWKRVQNYKLPYYLFRKDKKNIYFAGIFQKNEFCIITQKACHKVENIHERQPVILNEKDINKYLNLENSGFEVLNNSIKSELDFYQISSDVNKPTNNNQRLIQPV